jgi:hypothetical protein
MSACARLLRLSRGDLAVLFEAVMLAIPIEVALRLVRLDVLVARLGGERGSGEETGTLDARRAARLVEGAASFYPLRATCLKKSLVLYRILRRRGVPAELRLGVRKAEGDFTAHAWVESRGDILLGGGIAHLYSCFPTLLADARLTRTD